MFQVQFISHFTTDISYLDSVRIALEGGCRWIQLRMKNASDMEFEETAVAALRLCREYHATLILDDRVTMVNETGADGVHLGMGDMPVAEARKILGPDKIIGGTANTYGNIRYHAESGADYIGCGTFRHTTTKEKLAPVLGTEGYRSILAEMHRDRLTLPIVGIGGVTADDMATLHDTGLSGIALSGSILRARNPVEEMRRVMRMASELQ